MGVYVYNTYTGIGCQVYKKFFRKKYVRIGQMDDYQKGTEIL